jgi:uncharacterized membrane protein
MVIHFTIAIIYLACLSGLVGILHHKTDFFQKSFFSLVFLSILATFDAGISGSISKSYDQVSRTVAEMLHHARDGEITGVLAVIAFIIQLLAQRRKKRVSTLDVVFCLLATLMVSITGSIGGAMVYDHGLGVHATSLRQ